MAFKTSKEGFVAREARIADAEPYRVTSADEARALFRQLKKEHITTKGDRFEKTRRIAEAEPDNTAVRAAQAVCDMSDPITWHAQVIEDQAVEDAVFILEDAVFPCPGHDALEDVPPLVGKKAL